MEAAVIRILALNFMPIVLGGGHEIALPHYQAIQETVVPARDTEPSSVGVVSLDAHFDLRPYKQGGSSGTMFLQLADAARERGDSLSCFYLGIQKHANTVSLFKNAESHGFGYILAKDIDDASLAGVLKKLDDYLALHDLIYLTLCADVISAAYAPGVSSPQPFGLHPEIVLKLIKHVVVSGKVVGLDIAEVSPRFDEDNRTARLAAIIVFAAVNGVLGS